MYYSIKEKDHQEMLKFKIKPGHDLHDTIILVGQAKAASIRNYLYRAKKSGITVNLIEISQMSRKQLRGGLYSDQVKYIC